MVHGHYHRNAGSFYTPGRSPDDDRLEVVVSSAIGTTLTTSENGAGDPLGLSGMGKMLLDTSRAVCGSFSGRTASHTTGRPSTQQTRLNSVRAPACHRNEVYIVLRLCYVL